MAKVTHLFFLEFWLLIVWGCVFLTVYILRKHIRKKAVISWRDYEKHCANWLKTRWFIKIKLGRWSKDWGVDITAYKNGIKWVVQCKRHKSNVGLAYVQRHFWVAQSKNAKAYFITTKGFTKSAKEFAKGRVKLKVIRA